MMNIINIDSLKCATEFAKNENCFVSNATIKNGLQAKVYSSLLFYFTGDEYF